MRVFQVVGRDGVVRAALREGERVSVLERPHDDVATALGVLERGSADWIASARRAGALVEPASPMPAFLPVTPTEVWGAGVTYRRSADFREEGSGIYDRVYADARPELFFKATAARCVGPGDPIGRRADSTFTATEPELAVVLGEGGSVLGYTLANDVSAWDIERDNPLYLPQSKVYRGCFAFGPVIVTPDEIADPYSLTLTCRVARAGREVFAGEASTGLLKRRIPELVEWLTRSNPVPSGTILSTGTGIIQPMEIGLEEGDVVTITCPEIGTLSNPVAIV